MDGPFVTRAAIDNCDYRRYQAPLPGYRCALRGVGFKREIYEQELRL